MNITDKHAIVTGASQGLGRALALRLSESGAIVYAVARNSDALNALRDQAGNNIIPVPLDITSQESVASWIGSAFSAGNPPDILINNAGAGYFGQVEELPATRWHQMIDTNINGMYYLTSELVPLMKQNQSGCHIINIGSILGKVGSPERTGYCASKFAVQGFSEALSKELRYDGIKVTCFNPGSIATHFFEESGVKPHDQMLQPEDLADTLIHILQTPDNMLVSEITIRPLNPRPSNQD